MRLKTLALMLTLLMVFTVTGTALAYPDGPIDMIAPSGAGGGWDTTIRSVARVMGDQGIIDEALPVTNLVGGGGAVALADLVGREGEAHRIQVYSPPLLLINLTGQTDYNYQDITPIAQLIEDFGIFVVREDSPYETIGDVMDELKEDPGALSIGGGSAAGSMDHLQFLMAADAAGVEGLDRINYISYPGMEHVSDLMGGHIDLVSFSLSQAVGVIEGDDVRALAMTGSERVEEGVLSTVPTLKEEGIDTTFVNWRGLFGAPSMPDYAYDFWMDALTEMVETDQWAEICKNNGWNQNFRTGEDFEEFLAETNENYKILLEEIGMLEN